MATTTASRAAVSVDVGVGAGDVGVAVGEVGERDGEFDPAADVEKGRRLIEHEHARLLGEGAGDEHALALPVGEFPEGSIPERDHAEPLGRRPADFEVARRDVAGEAGVRVAAEQHHVADGSRPGSTRSVSTTAMRRARSRRSRWAIDAPSRLASPASGVCAPTSVRNSVDLPAPFGRLRRRLAGVGRQRRHLHHRAGVTPVPVPGHQPGRTEHGWFAALDHVDHLGAGAAGEHPDHHRDTQQGGHRVQRQHATLTGQLGHDGRDERGDRTDQRTFAGSSTRWSDVPTSGRARWGAASPMNPIGPTKAVTTPVSRLVSNRIGNRWARRPATPIDSA